MALAELDFQTMAIAEQQEEDSLYLIPTMNTDAGDINELLFGSDWLLLNVVVDKEHSEASGGEQKSRPQIYFD